MWVGSEGSVHSEQTIGFTTNSIKVAGMTAKVHEFTYNNYCCSVLTECVFHKTSLSQIGVGP